MAEAQGDVHSLIASFSAKLTAAPAGDTASLQPYMNGLMEIAERLKLEEKKTKEKEEAWLREKEEKEQKFNMEGDQLEERRRRWNEEVAQRTSELEQKERKWILEMEAKKKEWREEQEQKVALLSYKEKGMREMWELENEQREKDLQKRETAHAENAEKWEQTEKIMAQNSEKFQDVVHLNVGGKRYSLLKTHLLHLKRTYFESIITTSHSQQLPNGEVFIDRDSSLFRYIFEFITTGTVQFPEEHKMQVALEKEFAFFHIPLPRLATLFVPRISEVVLPYEYQQTLNAWLPNKSFVLRYKASVDGFLASDFHRNCDNRAPTLTIIRTHQGYILGGYSTCPWSSSRGYNTHPGCFIFTLKNPHSIPPTQFFPESTSSRSIWCSASDCMSFGNGDLHVTSESNTLMTSYTKFPYSYVDTTGKGNATFANGVYFRTDEIEVYSVHDIVQTPANLRASQSVLSTSAKIPAPSPSPSLSPASSVPPSPSPSPSTSPSPSRPPLASLPPPSLVPSQPSDS